MGIQQPVSSQWTRISIEILNEYMNMWTLMRTATVWALAVTRNGSAPRRQSLDLNGVPYPSIEKLLLSTTNLV